MVIGTMRRGWNSSRQVVSGVAVLPDSGDAMWCARGDRLHAAKDQRGAHCRRFSAEGAATGDDGERRRCLWLANAGLYPAAVGSDEEPMVRIHHIEEGGVFHRLRSPARWTPQHTCPKRCFAEVSCLSKTPLMEAPLVAEVFWRLMMCPSGATPDEIEPTAKSKVCVPAEVFSVNWPRCLRPPSRSLREPH